MSDTNKPVISTFWDADISRIPDSRPPQLVVIDYTGSGLDIDVAVIGDNEPLTQDSGKLKRPFEISITR